MTFCSRCIQWNGQLCLPTTPQSDTPHSTDLCRKGMLCLCGTLTTTVLLQVSFKAIYVPFWVSSTVCKLSIFSSSKKQLGCLNSKNNTWVSGSLLKQIYPVNKIIWAEFWVVSWPGFGPAKNEQWKPIIQGFENKTVFKMGWIWKWLVFLHQYLHQWLLLSIIGLRGRWREKTWLTWDH